jgi:hypothetical protein
VKQFIKSICLGILTLLGERVSITKIIAEKKKGAPGIFRLSAISPFGHKISMRGYEIGKGMYFSTLNELLTDGSIPTGEKELEFEEMQAAFIMRAGKPIAVVYFDKHR